jgi:hypothetical protein
MKYKINTALVERSKIFLHFKKWKKKTVTWWLLFVVKSEQQTFKYMLLFPEKVFIYLIIANKHEKL